MVLFRLGGNSEAAVNASVVLCLLGVGTAGALGAGWDAVRRRRGASHDVCGDPPIAPPTAPSSWASLLMLASYLLLLPGLFCVLFSFNIMLDFGLIKLGVGPGGGVDKVPPLTESMVGLMRLLRDTNCSLGSAAVVFYAVVIPAVKLLLLVFAQLRSETPSAARCIWAVQSISKWACPDMFAYILLLYLVRGLNHPRMLQAIMELDVGFVCFSLFCVCSTVASLGIRSKDEGSSSPCWTPVARWLGLARASQLVAAMAAGFFLSFVSGFVIPVMALRVDLDDMYSPKGPIPAKMMGFETKPVIDQLHIPELAMADVSLSDAVAMLGSWSLRGEADCFIAFMMILVFVATLTIADMAALGAATYCLRCGEPPRALEFTRMARTLRKLSMLDVMIAGVVVVTLCMSMYHKDGIFVSMRHGVMALLIAEILHYVTYYLVISLSQLHATNGHAYDDLTELGVGLGQIKLGADGI